MKIIALMGSARKSGMGCKYVSMIKDEMINTSEYSFEFVFLSDYNISLCKGCMACYKNGEKACSLKDDYLHILSKLLDADAVIFYSPTYTISISGIMKNFFDRSSFVLHRPLFKGKHAVILTAVAAFGDKQALGTLKWIVSAMGFKIIGKLGVVNVKYESNPKYASRIKEKLQRITVELVRHIKRREPIQPTLFELIGYNYQKSIFSKDIEGCRNDCEYWKNAGWTHPSSDYFYPVEIAFRKKWISRAISKLLYRSGLLPH